MTFAQFVKQLEASGLISQEELSAFLHALPAAQRPTDPRHLASELVRQKKLTEYQARVVYQGHGTLVLGNYVVEDKIGQGGMGVVLKARHRMMGRQVALKVMSPKAVESPDSVRRFQREVRAAARLTHPNIVAAFDADQAGQTHFLVLEYVDGKDLSSLVKSQGRLDVAKAIDYILQAARGLQYAHEQGVIHRDIKPGNLLLDEEGTVKILDMGLARLEGAPAEQAELTATDQIMGTVDYMAPEQAIDTKHADARADIYSLGITLWFLLTGQSAYKGNTLMAKLVGHRESPIPSLIAACPEASTSLEAVFTTMVAKRPAERYQSMAEVIGDLVRIQTGVLLPSVETTTSDSNLNAFLTGIVSGSAPGAITARLTQAPTTQAVDEMAATMRLDDAASEAHAQLKPSTTPQPTPPPFPSALAANAFIPAPPGSPHSEPSRCCSSAFGLSRPLHPTVSHTRFQAPKVLWQADPTSRSKGNTAKQAAPAQKVGPLSASATEREVAEWILALGGTLDIWTASGEVPKPKQLPAAEKLAIIRCTLTRALRPGEVRRLATLKALQVLTVDGHTVTDENMESIGKIESLKELSVGDASGLSSKGTQCLAQLNGLKILRMQQLNGDALEPIQELKGLRRLALPMAQVDDSHLEILARLKELQSIDLSSTQITDDGVVRLGELPCLQSVNLDNTKATSRGVQAIIGTKSLVHLHLAKTSVADDVFPILGQMPQLQVVWLKETRVTTAGMTAFAKAMPRCVVLHPNAIQNPEELETALWLQSQQRGFSAKTDVQPSNVSGSGKLPAQSFYIANVTSYSELHGAHGLRSRNLDHLTIKYPSPELLEFASRQTFLTHISIHEVSKRASQDFKSLSHLENLQTVLCSVGSEALLEAWKLPQSVHGLALNSGKYTDQGLVHLSHLHNLHVLQLVNSTFRGRGLAHLTPLTRLRILDLKVSAITDEAVPHLKAMPSLRVLNLTGTKVSADGAAEIQRALPDCIIFHGSLE